MAGQAAKKAAKASESTANRYFPIIVVINIVYVVFRVFYNYSTFGPWQAFGLLLTSAVYYICYNGMVDAARMGVSGGTYFDILAVCLAAQTVSSFSSYGWYIYLLVPGYYMSISAHWVFQKLAGWMSSQPADDGSEEAAAREAKRLAKKERKAARGPKMRSR